MLDCSYERATRIDITLENVGVIRDVHFGERMWRVANYRIRRKSGSLHLPSHRL